MLRRTMIAPAPALALLAGCGNARTPPPNLTTPAVPHRAHTVNFPLAGIRLRVPGNWTVAVGQSPLVMTLSSGQALVAVWRYQLLHGRHAIELSATERIAGQARPVRSVHVSFGGAEYVIDEYAPLRYFHAVGDSVFSPIKRSLWLSPVAGA